MIAVSRAIIANPPPSNSNWYSLVEQAQYYIVYCYGQLKDDDGLLSEGEKFLKKYPASQSASLVQMLMNNAINHKHAIEDGKKAAQQQLAALSPADKADPCKRAPIYKDNQQLDEAKRDWLLCDARGGPAGWGPGNMAMILASLALDTRDAPLMKKSLARLQKENPSMYRTIAFWEKEVGGDD
jgi:hypothetical protein